MAAKRTGKIKLGGIIIIVLGIVISVVFIVFQASVTGRKQSTGSRQFLRGSLFINEIMASNNIAYADKNGDFYDWVEIYNDSDNEADLSGFHVCRSLNEEGWVFDDGTSVPAHGFLIIYFCGENREGLYLPWRLSKKGGEELIIKDENGYLVDRAAVPALDTDCTVSRSSSGVWTVTSDITPGYPNTDEGLASYRQTLRDLSTDIQITEVCTRNVLGPTAEDGGLYDWVELYNAGDSSVSLEGWYMTDDEDDPRKWRFPAVTVAPGKYMLIYASGKDGLYDGIVHTSFKLSDSAGSVILHNKRGIFIASATYEQPEDYSSAVLSASGYKSTVFVTPGYANTDEGYEAFLRSEGIGTSAVIISEIMLRNDALLPTDGNRYYDWAELVNISSADVKLSDYYLSDTENDLFKTQLPARVLSPGERCIVYLSGEEGASTPSTPHTSFKLDNKGEIFFLSDKNGVHDYVYVKDIPYNYSYGRVADSLLFSYSEEPSPLAENNPGVRFITPMPSVDTSEGVYEGIDTLSVALEGEGLIRYTLDGSLPDESSPVYSSALEFTETAVLRAAAYEEGKLPSRVLTQTYIINEGHTFDVLSIVTSPDNLWSEETGIYATGLNAEAEYPYLGANYYEDWEREAYTSLFSDGGICFSLDCGLQLFGQSGRVKPKKSFQLKFKEKYGEDYLRCEVFDTRPGITRYDTLVVRSGSQDYDRSTFRDELLTSLVDGEMSLLTQAYRPCVLYLNGEYWGIYFLREKVDEDFISQRLNVDTDSVDILRGNSQVVVGDNDDYLSFYYYAKKLDMTVPSNYAYVKSKIDIESFIDYYIAQAYTGNRDVTNVKFYKTSQTDNKWHWIFFDIDYGFDYAYSAYDYTLYNLIKPEGTGYENKISNELIRALLLNPEFLDLFLTRYGYWLSTALEKERVLSFISDFSDLMAPEQERNAARWSFKLSTYKWYVSTLRDFVDDGVNKRADILINEAATLFSLDEKQVLKYFYPDKFLLLYPEEAENGRGEEEEAEEEEVSEL